MSLLDTASLIVTPNGYKEGKLYSVIPSDGSGDLSVTRATTATRVNSAGLVELVPYNLLSYSEQIDNGYWLKYQVSIAANNITAPDGTLTADKLTQTGGGAGTFYVVSQPFSGGLVSLSCYYKKGTNNVAVLEINRGAESCLVLYNLDTQVITPSFNYVSTNMEDVGNGWFRCSVLTNQSAGTANYIAFGSIGNNADTLYNWGAQLNEGTILPYQKTETRLNIPRLDYSNGTCPSLLVEPQRTNGQEYSEDLTQSSYWGYGAVSVSANQVVSPSGILNADKVIEAATTARHELYSRVYNFTGSNACSFFIKSAGRQYISVLSGGDPSLGGATFDVVNGLVTYTSGSSNATIEDFGNGWFKCSFTTTRTGSSQIYWCFRTISATPDVETYAGDGTSGFYIWGAQIEAGSYATSYIPTTSASVTRNADVISKTGISSLIGQTEGTFFLDMYYDGVSSNFVLMQTFQNASQFNVIQLYLNSFKRLAFEVGNDAAILSPNSLVAGRYKMAGAYKNNDFVLYLNGDLIGTDTSGAVIATDAITFNDYFALTSTYKQVMEINATALWKTRLTNAQLATLTTI